MSDAPQSNRFSLPPRFHNVLSYSGALLVFPVLLDWSKPGVVVPATLWCAHFLKRVIESLWVHRYSGRSVSPFDYLVEYLYYWGFAAWIAGGLSAEQWTLPSFGMQILAAVVFCCGEIGNAWSHLYLRSLRARSGSQEKKLPCRGMFLWVACPHYLFEITSWLGFAILTRVWGSAAFFIVGSGILSSYAWARHQAYRKEFDGLEGRQNYPQQRRAMVPLVF